MKEKKGQGKADPEPQKKLTKTSSSIPYSNDKKTENNSKKASDDFFIVCNGASAGGLDAMEHFFKNMPQDSGMAFVIITHLAPNQESILPELIKKYTPMKVFLAEEGMQDRTDCIYVIPPGNLLSIQDRTLHIETSNMPYHPHLPIDFFFRSLAQDIESRAIGVILSGTGTDGTQGLKAIKFKLGMILSQEPESAEYSAMPRSAIETGLVDFVLPVQAMPEQLVKYVRHAGEIEEKETLEIKDAGKDLDKIIKIIHNCTGHDFSFYKKNTICRRIERRMNINQIYDVSKYIHFLQQNSNEIDLLLKDLLIGVTHFFRDPEAFDLLKKSIIPQILKNKSPKTPVRVWVACCSTGEEAYSIAMVIKECIIELGQSHDIQIFATDIDIDAIDKARAGVYPDNISADVSPERLKQFFYKENGLYRIRQEIREMIVFSIQNIIKDPPFTRLDLISCRDFLIYLDPELQKKILPIFHYSLNPDGFLFLGPSENVNKFEELFWVIEKKWKIFKRNPHISPLNQLMNVHSFFQEGIVNDKVLVKPNNIQHLHITQFMERVLLEEFVPACVIIDEGGKIQYFQGHIGKFLDPIPGKANLDIYHMIREDLRLEVANLIREATSRNQSISKNGLCIKINGSTYWIDLTVKPFSKIKGFFLVVFQEAKLPPLKPSRTKSKHEAASDKHTVEIEEELRFTRENLNATIQDLETANEELKSANEELQSTNEELQSTNEEMETSKEELQSLNEELSTVNLELQFRNDELSVINNDMKNLLESIEIATIFLSRELHIRRFTSQASQMVNLIQTDVGRPLSDISSSLIDVNLEKYAGEVLKKLIPVQKEVQTSDGHWFKLRITPYLTRDNFLDGVVITLMDIHDQKINSEKFLKLSKELDINRIYYQEILNTIRESLVVMDEKFRITFCNRAFYKTFRLDSKDIEGKSFFEISDGKWDVPRLRQLLEQIILQNKAFENFQVKQDFRSIGPKSILLNARKVERAQHKSPLILVAIEDLTSLEDHVTRS